MRYIFVALLLAANICNMCADIIHAQSCAIGDVQDAISRAGNGDTVLLPACTETWSSTVSINDKEITLRGLGPDSTIIHSSNDRSVLHFSGEKPFRVTQLRFVNNGGRGVYITTTSMGWRIDNCEFVSAERWEAVHVYGYTYGVIHNCLFSNARVIVVDGDGHASWKRPLSLGTSSFVYVESNKYIRSVYGNIIDANHGGRYVFRYNDVENGSCEAHSLQNAISGAPYGIARGTRSYEIYNNRFEAIDNGHPGNWVAVFIRGGTGVIFNNSIHNSGGPRYSLFGVVDNVRSFSERAAPLLRCDGTNPLDGNIDDNGYPCLDQIGRSTDAGSGDNFNPQDHEPLYSWNNTLDGRQSGLVIHNNCDHHIQEGRDFYNYSTRSGYVPYPYPHPFTLADHPGEQRSLDLQSELIQSEAELFWEPVSGARTYKIVTDWDEENGIITTATEITATVSAEGNLFMVYALNDEGEILAAEGAFLQAGTTGVIDEGVSNRYSLHQNYPNPFNPATTIRYQLAEGGHVSLKVFDLLGREIVTLVDEVKPAGKYEILWNGRNSSGIIVNSGIYFYKILTEDGNIDAKRMVLIK